MILPASSLEAMAYGRWGGWHLWGGWNLLLFLHGMNWLIQSIFFNTILLLTEHQHLRIMSVSTPLLPGSLKSALQTQAILNLKIGPVLSFIVFSEVWGHARPHKSF